MNKSTPINQLPNQLSVPQNTFVNDQQRQMITQAQQAISTSQMPQNTQISSDILAEDDATIQDMLNNLNSGQQQEMPQIPVHSQDELYQRLAATNNVVYNQLPQQPPSYMPQAPPTAVQPTATSGFSSKTLTTLIQNEFKLVGLVFLVVLLVQFIPFHKYIGRYIAIEKLPYHDVILRAIIASLLVVVIKKLID